MTGGQDPTMCTSCGGRYELRTGRWPIPLDETADRAMMARFAGTEVGRSLVREARLRVGPGDLG